MGGGEVQPARLPGWGLAVLLPLALPLVSSLSPPRQGRGLCPKGVEARPGLFRELQLASEQQLPSCGSRAALSPPDLPCYFRPSAVGGHWGFSVLRAHTATTVSNFILLCSRFPLCCCFSFHAETVWSPCC